MSPYHEEPREESSILCQDIALIRKDIEYIKEKTKEIKEQAEVINTKMEANYVTKLEFDPIKKIVYGLVTLILTAVVVASVSLVLSK